MDEVRSSDNANSVKEIGISSWTQRPWLKLEPLLRVLLMLLIIMASIWLTTTLWQVVSFFSNLILLFFASWLVALMLANPVHMFVRWGWPKIAAIGASYILLVAFISGFVLIVLPGLIAQTRSLSDNLSKYTSNLEQDVNKTLQDYGINSIDLAQASSQLQSIGADVLKNALTLATGIVSFLLQLLLLVIISASLLAGRDYQPSGTKSLKTSPTDASKTSLWHRFPERWRRWIEFVRLSFERNFGVFLGGQMVVAIIYGVSTWLIMLITGFEYPVTTGCICGMLMIIPFFGGPLSLLPPLIVAFGPNDDKPILIVLVLLFILQTALLNVVLPKLVGRSSGVGPVTTLFVLLAGAQVGGIFGVLLAVPIAGVAKNIGTTLVNEFFTREETQAALTNNTATTTTVTVQNPTATKIEVDVATRTKTDKALN